MENYEFQSRDHLAKKIKSEADHEKRREILQKMINTSYEYQFAKLDKTINNEKVSRSQVLFFNDREKEKSLESFQKGFKTKCWKYYIPLRLEGTLLGKVMDEIDESLDDNNGHGYSDFYDFLSSIPTGLDMSDWASKVSEDLNVEIGEELKVILSDDPESKPLTITNLRPITKNSWANMGGILFEKMIDTNRVGIREDREGLIFQTQEEWIKDELLEIENTSLDLAKLNYETLKLVFDYKNIFLKKEFDETEERQMLGDMEKFSEAVNSGADFLMEIPSTELKDDLDITSSESIVFWLKDLEKKTPGNLYFATLRLAEDRRIKIPFPLFLEASGVKISLSEFIKTQDSESGEEKQNDGLGCKLVNLYFALESAFGKQFRGVL